MSKTGQYDKTIQEFQKMDNVRQGLGHLGNAYARRGFKAEAGAVVPQLKDHVDKTGVGRYEIALLYVGLQESDKAFEWLESAYWVRDKGLAYLKIGPCLDLLRSDRRFASLVQRVGIPSSQLKSTDLSLQLTECNHTAANPVSISRGAG
jgi:hypothetical protein